MLFEIGMKLKVLSTGRVGTVMARDRAAELYLLEFDDDDYWDWYCEGDLVTET